MNTSITPQLALNGTAHEYLKTQSYIINEIIKAHGRIAADLARAIMNSMRSATKGNRFGRLINGIRYFFRTIKEWSQILCCSTRSINRAIQFLRDQGYISVVRESGTGGYHNRKNYYTWNVSRKPALNKVVPEGDMRHGGTDISDMVAPYTILPLNLNNIYKEDKIAFQEEPMQEPRQPDVVYSSIQAVKSDPILEMRESWNRILGEKKGIAIMNWENQELAMANLQKYFKGDISAWEAYLHLIASSPYIMANTFCLRFKTALTGDFIERVLRGELGVKIPVKKVFPTEEEIPYGLGMKEKIDALGELPAQKEVRHRVLSFIGEAAYKDWFHDHKVIEVSYINIYDAKPKPQKKWVMSTTSPFVKSQWRGKSGNGWIDLREAGLLDD